MAKAASPTRGPQPYTVHVTCNTWSEAICFANIDPIPAGKRFVVDYVSVSAWSFKASDQRLLVRMVFQSGSSTEPTAMVVSPVMQFQAGGSSANLYHASEKVVAFAENVSPYASGQLYVNRFPASGPFAYNANVSLHATGYLEDM